MSMVEPLRERLSIRCRGRGPTPLLRTPGVGETREIPMAKFEVGDKVIVTQGDFKGDRGAIVDKTLFGDGIRVALESNGKEIKTEEGHVSLAD